MLQAFIQANQDAIVAMQSGNETGAIELLRQTLRGIQQRTTEDTTTDAGADDEDTGSCDEQRQGAAQPLCYHINSHATRGCDDNSSPGGFFYLYNRAFSVSINVDNAATLTPREELEAHTMLTTVVLFNMALSFHRQGVSIATNSSMNLGRALRVYSMIPNLHEGSTGVCVPVLLRLALWNNMGHLYSRLFEEDEAFHCQGLLTQDLYEEAHCEAHSNKSLLMDDYNFFYLSTLICSSKNTRRAGLIPAPAA
jgi:hypothetical protein